eukprot:CAMPEP_0113659758 /NCGR_PEP_ID=MMETSP0017_2-20120614/32535_1 /TAXON_ID=2856 /ORGANISM="Cylindrotheca closterium" /LENGTH=1119 /DNA_ID=CAMNT_0000574343 /DNA_START=167 /DNA_END=3526 /DNA_ORIENTATION=- /assembly_acc=CAM_ASM_000147
MPTQSRGFYNCDYCGIACDTPEEAKAHEFHCPKRPGGQPNNAAAAPSATPAQPRYPPGAMPPSHPYLGMPPQEMEYPPSMMHPMAMNPKDKCIALLGPHERTALSVEDAIACQNIEFFEPTAEEISQLNRNGVNVVAKQAGVRCIHSGRIPATFTQSTRFPGSLGDIAKCVRTIADNHLSVNERVPPEVREACKRAASKREQGEEGKDNDEMEALIRHCVEFCGRMRIANKQPHKTGIEFVGAPEMGQYPYAMSTPTAPGRMAGPGPYSADRYPPMMGMERMSFRTPGPPMPRAGPPPSAMMGGAAQGPEGISATPLQSTRSREGAPGMYPGERDGAPNQAGYPPQYPPGQGPSSSFGRPDGPPGGPNPSQANYEGQEQGQMPAQRQDGSPPSGYPEMAQYDLPPHFPYYQERDRSWHCKYCSHAPPQYRDPQSIWNSPNGSPPPGNFIDEHLNMCRFYHQTISSQHMYQGASYAPSMFGPQHPASMYGPPPGPWDAHYPSQPGFSYPGMPDGRYPEEAYAADQRGGPPGQRPNLLGPPSSTSGPPTRTSAPPALPRQENSADTIRLCVNHLLMKEREYYARDPENAKIPRLVLEDDRLLLTDYFFHLMKQLRLCRFSESDRKTRGGKREKIKIGYGGLQCVHCADVPNSRKFFWSNVDRLANSFAEIPGHVLKCRRCPQQTKEALLSLKSFHPEQMARLPRGSQKVFFRRMWRRLHDEDPGAAGIPASASNEENVTPEKANMDSPESKGSDTKSRHSSPGSPKNDDCIVPILPTKEAAEILAKSKDQEKDSAPLPKILLAVSEDKNWLSDMDCFIRKQIEVFCATEEDIATAQADRKYPVKVGQVGIRCVHCSTSEGGAIGQAVSYPFSISGIYESVREFQRLHLDSCENVTEETKLKLATFKGSSSLSSVLRKYYVSAARALGLQDSSEGIRASGESVPITSHGAFSTPEPQSVPKLPVKSEDDEAKSSDGDARSGSPSEKAPATSEKDEATSSASEQKKSEESAAESKESEEQESEKDASAIKAPESKDAENEDSADKAPVKKESESTAPENSESDGQAPESRSDSPVSTEASGKKRTSPTPESEPPSKVAKTDAAVEMNDVATTDTAKSPRKTSE